MMKEEHRMDNKAGNLGSVASNIGFMLDDDSLCVLILILQTHSIIS